MKSTVLDADLFSPGGGAHSDAVEELLAPVNAVALSSGSLILGGGIEFIRASGRFRISKYVLLGALGGDRPMRVGFFGGLGTGQFAASAALAKLLVEIELAPALAKDYALFVYPVVAPRSLAGAPAAPNVNALFWKRSLEPEVLYFEQELRRHQLHGFMSFHVDAHADGLYAKARGRLLAEEVVRPALGSGSRAVPLSRDAVRILPDSPTGRRRDYSQGKFLPPPDIRPFPFEVSLHVPASAAAQSLALPLATKEILHGYRKFAGHARHL